MNIVLYQNKSERNRMNKELTELITISGTLKDMSSVINPVLMMTGIDQYISNLNYMYIEDFNRYYFINSIDSVRNGLWQISGHVDVLMSFASEILQNEAIIERNTYDYNLLLNDGLFKTQQNPRIEQYAFPAGFNTLNFVLALAGH